MRALRAHGAELTLEVGDQDLGKQDASDELYRERGFIDLKCFESEKCFYRERGPIDLKCSSARFVLLLSTFSTASVSNTYVCARACVRVRARAGG